MDVNDIQILTGWSRATLYRRMRGSEFPAPTRKKTKNVWDPVEILEWVSIQNLLLVLGPQQAAQFEQSLKARAEVDPLVRSPIGRSIERERAAQNSELLKTNAL